MIELHYKKDISSTLHRSMIVMLLLCSFALGVKAQEVWWPQGTHATGIDNGVVYLNDLEDHNWTYYSGVNQSVDKGYYNNKYNGTLYSPNPRNVMITYKGRDINDSKTSNVKVSIDTGEDQHTFVYYKTLEEGSTSGEYPYTVISNPFSVRPSVVNADGTKTYYGFGGWKIVSGHQYIKRANGTQALENAILELDEEITFVGLTDNYTKNCISANIVFQTTWVPLNNIVRLTNTTTSRYHYKATGGTYETNILVLQTNQEQHMVAESPCTVMMVEPDGSDDYRDDYMFNKLLRPAEGVNNRTKIEFIHWQPSGEINARGRNFTIGRGIVMDGTTRAVYGILTNPEPVNHTLKVESGKYLKFENYGVTPTEIIKQCVIFGCDYDRAKGDNSKLEFTSDLRVAKDMTLPTNADSEIFRTYSLSGRFVTGADVDDVEAATAASCYYLSVRDGAEKVLGHRYLEILGGEWINLAGGWSPEHPTDKRSLTIRIKGGEIKGSIYGGAQHVEASGIVTYIITGGTINGWVAGGANGTTSDRGELFGSSFIYVGGDAQINSKGSTTLINRAVGGNVFGAGCGYSATSSSGQVTLGTNVVIADNAYVERGVYGGGSYGYCPTDKTSNIYITGGTVGGNAGGVEASGDKKEYNPTIQGGVYSGACQNKGGSVNIFMTGGTINGGIYGGSNASGEVAGPITLTMTGGTVENIFGGGNEAPVKGNTNVTITGGEVKQNVYGGGNKAAVTGSTNVMIGK